MVLLKRGVPGLMFATASEKVTEFPAVYNIKFTGGIEKVPVIITDAEDLSPFPERYNEFYIDTVSLFQNLDNGYYVYEITDASGHLLEVGKMKLEGDPQLTIQYQDTPVEYKTYGK